MTRDEARMGEYLKQYKPPLINAHKVVNFLLVQPAAMITMDVEFPDVSFWQGEIDYDIMGSKTDAIILRAGQNKWVDTRFERNYTEAKRVGLLVGIYWFYDGRASPQEQADLLLSILRNKKLELEVYIDWEHNYGGAHEGLRNVVAMMELVEKAGWKVGMYTGYYWFRANSNPILNASQYNYLKTKPLWLAWYSNTPAHVLIPAPWTQMNVWQWGTPAWAWGQKTAEIDMNFFNGTEQEFTFLYGLPTGELPMADYVELKSLSGSNHSIRQTTPYPQTPHIMGQTISTLLAGTVAKTEPSNFYVYTADVIYQGVKQAYQGDRWWKVQVGGLTGWIAERHKGVNYLSAELFQENPTTTLPDLPVSITLGDDVTYQKQTVNVVLKPK